VERLKTKDVVCHVCAETFEPALCVVQAGRIRV
jgi:hypothetical protein